MKMRATRTPRQGRATTTGKGNKRTQEGGCERAMPNSNLKYNQAHRESVCYCLAARIAPCACGYIERSEPKQAPKGSDDPDSDVSRAYATCAIGPTDRCGQRHATGEMIPSYLRIVVLSNERMHIRFHVPIRKQRKRPVEFISAGRLRRWTACDYMRPSCANKSI
jgi:hypothetical protein